MTANQLGDGSADGVFVPTGSKVIFYGSVPVAQRASTSLQRTSNVATTLAVNASSVNSSALNNAMATLQEVMNTLAAYGLWSIS